MKKFLFGCALAVMSFAMPQAFANYCCPCPPPCGDMGRCDDFNGIYVGGNVGVFSNTAFLNDFDAFTTGGGQAVIHTNVTAGVQLGYDWQCANKLLGIVADWNWANTHRRHNAASGPDCHRHRFDWFTTIRARAGLTLCDALVYVTLGAAVADVEARFNSTVGDTCRNRRTQWGWVTGAGIEYLLGCGWSLGGEFLFLNFSEHNKTITVNGSSFRLGHSDTAYVGRILLNYRIGNLFGGGGLGL